MGTRGRPPDDPDNVAIGRRVRHRRRTTGVLGSGTDPLAADRGARGWQHPGRCGPGSVRQPRRANCAVHWRRAWRCRDACLPGAGAAGFGGPRGRSGARRGARRLRDSAVRVRREQALLVRPLAHHPGGRGADRDPARDRHAQPCGSALPGYERAALLPRRAGFDGVDLRPLRRSERHQLRASVPDVRVPHGAGVRLQRARHDANTRGVRITCARATRCARRSAPPARR